jgi:hypothetical protein
MKLNEIEKNQTYATSAQLKNVAGVLQNAIDGGKFEPKPKSNKPLPHIRVHNASKSEIIAVATELGLKLQPADDTQLGLSTQFKNNIFGLVDPKTKLLYSFVISTRGDGENAGIAKKALTPTGLGLSGQKFKRKELIQATRHALTNTVRDKRLRDILDQLVTIAERRTGSLSSDDMKYIADSRAVISSDFGEILAPIKIMSNTDTADFPSGNNPIVDVYVTSNKGMITGYAIKSLTGSGNSFAAITDLMDRYESTLKKNSKEKAMYEIIKMFKKGQPGSVKDKIIGASLTAKTAEGQTLLRILGSFEDFDSLQQQISQKIRQQEGWADYGDFLNLVYPASIAGGWGREYGMPADSAFYMSGESGTPPRQTQAGKKSYDSNPPVAAADIITYILGQGLLQMATKGPDAEKYNTMMTNIVSSANVQLGKIDLTNDGSLEIKSAPFSGIKFRFDYHAPSHKPGNNSPGFIMAKEQNI